MSNDTTVQSTWPAFGDDEVDAVVEVLRSGRVNQWTGDAVAGFETAFGDWAGAGHAVAVANGTVAIELALQCLGIGAGDEVIVPSRTFIATASAVVARGARPIVADIDPVSQNLSAATVEPLIGPRTRAIIAVHLYGWPCEMDALIALAADRGLFVIEDCAQAHGARYRGAPVGSIGHVSAFSFCQDKIMTTGGEGGMLVTGDADRWARAWSYKDHGKRIDSRVPGPGTGFRWVHDGFGTNWRMTALQAAIGREQLRRVDGWLARRRRNAGRLMDVLQTLPAIAVTRPPAHVDHAYYKLHAQVVPERLRGNWTRDRVIDEVRSRGVPCSYGVCAEIYRERAFTARGWGPSERLRAARHAHETSLLFLVDPTLDDDAIDRTASVVAAVMEDATC